MNRPTDEELTRLAYARLRSWQSGAAEVWRTAGECRQILRLKDPMQDAPGTEPTLQLQTLRSTFNNCVADQMDNLPEAVMLPETPDKQPLAEDLTDLTRHILSLNDFEGFYRRRVEDCFCTGTAVTQILWDPDMDEGRGNIALIRWPVESLLWDPLCGELQESRAVMKLSLHPMSWYAARYPEKLPLISADGDLYPLHSRSRVSGEDEEQALLLEYWWRTYDAETRRYAVHTAYMAGGCLLYRRENVYAHGMYPFVLDVYSPVEGSPAGDGLIRELAPMMRYINRYAHYIDMNLRMSSKGRLLVDRGAGIDRRALCDWEKDVIEGDRIDAGAVKWLQTVPFSGAAMQQMLQLESSLKQDSGQNQFSRGETVGGVTAASAISALQEAGGKIARMRTAMLNRGFRQMVLQILWLVYQFYEPGRVECVTGRDGARVLRFDPGRTFPENGFQTPGYLVEVQVQRRNPLRQQAQNELLLQAYQMAAQAGQYFPLTTLFELLQTDGKEKILPALRQAEELPRLLAKARAENEDLRGMCGRAQELMRSGNESELLEMIAALMQENEVLTGQLTAAQNERQTREQKEEDVHGTGKSQ